MDEVIDSLTNDPDKFIDAILENPIEKLNFLQNHFNPTNITIFESFFAQKEEAYSNGSIPEKICLIFLAANLMVYFSKSEEIQRSCVFYDKLYDRLYDKPEVHYDNLFNNDTPLNLKKSQWDAFLGCAYHLAQYLPQAIRFYTKAINSEKKCQELQSDILSEYLGRLSQVHLIGAYKACDLKPPAYAAAECQYDKAIKTAKEALQLPTQHQQDILWCLAKATYGLAKLKRKEKKYEKAIDLFLESISANIKGFQEESSSFAYKTSFLNDLKNHFILFLRILKKHKTILNDSQENLLQQYIHSLEEMTKVINEEEGVSVNKLKSEIKEILPQIKTLISSPETSTASFWKKSLENPSTLLTAHILQSPNPSK